MKFCGTRLQRRGALIGGLLFFAVLAGALEAHGEQKKAATAERKVHERHYYIAAERVEWDFAPSQRNLVHNSRLPLMYAGRTKWPKLRYIEYTDDTFTKKKPQPEWLGILGPVIRAEVGDTIYVHFLNRTQRPQSIHSHGVRYDKDSEGAHYAFRGAGASVPAGQQFTYKWLVTHDSGPASNEPSSRAWFYHGHVDEPEETNAGLMGPIVITAAGKAKPDGSPMDVDREFLALFMIFDQSPPPPAGTRRSQLQLIPPEFEFHAINGYLYGNLQGLVMREGERVRWHVMAMGTETDLHTPHWHGHVLNGSGHSEDVAKLLPMNTETLDMVASNVGTWMFQCHVNDHLDNGMMTYYTVLPKEQSCPVEFADGTFWKDNQASFVARNKSSTEIRTVRNKLEVIGAPYDLANLYTEDGNVTEPLAVGGWATRTVRGAPADPQKTLGYVVVPEAVTFANGGSWKPRYRGECSKTFWRDAAVAVPMEALPPDRTTEHDEAEVE